MHDHASLNRAYRVVFNAALGAMVAVPETVRSHAGGTTRGIAASAGLFLALAGPGAWAQGVASNALPQDGKVAAGQVTIDSPRNNHLRIEQASERAIVNWKSFDVGSEASVRFVQPSAAAVILNRVQSAPGSQILGSLDANARVYLVNPAGILFGPKSQVNVGGLTASTLGIRDDDFLQGRDRFTADGVAGSVVNQGRIAVTPGGRIALIGTRVENAGQILAPNGQVVLAAGRQATLAIGANGHLQVEVDAAQVGTLVANGGLVQADGGQVILTAQGAGALASSVVSNTGTLQARTIDGTSGRILLLADMGSGRVEAGGTLDASAPNGADGGFIETSAARVKIAPDLKVTTAAAQGRTGTWLVDPPDYTIAATGGDMTGAQLSAFLATSNMVILSSSGANAAGNGDIHVNDAVSWSANTLTLTAARDININAVMTASGTSALALNPATTNGGSTGVGGGTVKVGLGPTGFRGRVDFPGRSGTGFLTINGFGYTVINALGSAGSTTGTDLQGINGALGGRYALGSDIDASPTAGWNLGGDAARPTVHLGFAPIGGTASFTGTFEGLGHTIDGLTIDRGNENHVGLFSTTSGTIRNVGMTGGRVRADLNYSLAYRVGALAGVSSGTIVNTFGTTEVNGRYNVGGLVGLLDVGGRVIGSRASSTVTGTQRIGGLVGSVGRNTSTTNPSIAGSHASGTVTGEDFSNAVGGLAGFNDGFITASSADATVYGLGGVGGLVGDNNRRITLSHAGGSVTGEQSVGGLAGFNYNSGRILNTYSVAAVQNVPMGCCGVSNTGGLVGYNLGGQINNSYAAGPVTGGGAIGGLVGYLNGGSVVNSFWNIDSSGMSSSDGGTGLTAAQMTQASSFTGWSITAAGGGAPTVLWRIYEGQTAPLLRAFLTPLTVLPAHDGTGTPLANAGAYSLPVGADASRIFGAAGDALTLSSTGTAGNYRASVDLSGLYSNQAGYDILAAPRIVATPGSAAGDVRLDNPVTWTGGTVHITATNNVDLNGQALSGTNGTLTFDAGNQIVNAGSVGVNLFELQDGTWNQVATTLPAFSATDFRISGGTFLRAQGGDGSQAAPYQLADIYGVQGVASAGMGDKAHVLVADIDATGTATWNAAAGFAPITLDAGGSFDGQGHTIAGLRINRPLEGGVGLFSYNHGTVANLGLVGGEVTGHSDVGAIAGWSGGLLENVYSTATVAGTNWLGGLVGVNVGQLLDSHATGTVTGTGTVSNIAGGLAGSNFGVIARSHATGEVSAIQNHAGGLVGENEGTIEDSYATGNATAEVYGAGGLVGRHLAGSIVRSYATGRSEAKVDRAGGLVGHHFGAIADSYATGDVTGGGNVGALVGYAGNGSSVTNSYATGAVSGDLPVGGLVGARESAAATVTGSYWDTATSGQSASAGGTGRTTAQMQAQSTFTGWDFGGTWVQYEGHTSPLLRAFLTPLTVTANDATKIYDGQSYDGAAGLGYSFAPDMTKLLGTPSYASGINAGTHAIAAGGLYSHQQGYLIDFVPGTLTISRRPLALTNLAPDKVYDGTNVAPLTGGTLAGLVAGETLGYSASGTFADKNAGTGKPVAVTGTTLSDGTGLASNYTITDPTAITGTIRPRTLNVTAAGVTRTYDGTTAATVDLGDDRLGSDVLTFTSSASYADKNVGTGKAVSVTGIAITGGADAGNYLVGNTTAATTAGITPRPLNVTASAADKVYDGLRDAAATLADDRVAADVFTVTHASAEFSDKNVGNDKAVTVAGFGLSGTDAANYALVNNTASTTADITPRPLNVTVTAGNRGYNGNRNATVSFFSPDWIPGDDLTYTGSGLFDDKNAGNGKTVTISGFGVSGADVGNYALVAVPTTATANILPRNIAVFFVGGDKEYDRTTAADVFLAGDSRVAGDDLTVTYGPASFADWNAGVGKTVTITGVTLTGPDAGNYNLASSSVTRLASIFPRSLRVSATATDKTYDGNTSATVNLADDRIAGDVLTIASDAATFADRHAGVDKLVTVTGITMGGTDGGNYQLANDRTTATADITPRRLNVTAAGGTKVYDQTDTAPVTLSDDRLAIDSFSVAATARFDNRNAGTGKPIAVSDILIFGTNAGNYELANDTTTATGTISPRDVTVHAVGGNKTYDGLRDTTIGFQVSGVLPSDALAVAAHDPVAFADKHAGDGKALHVTGITLGGADAGNYNLVNTAADTTASIFRRGLFVSANGIDKVYDGTAAADVNLFDNRVAGDVFAIGSRASFADRNAGAGKVVTVTDLSFSGPDAANYVVPTAPFTTLADITPRPLAVTATGVDKVYDRSTAATVNFSDNRVAGDQFAVTATARFGDFNVGSGKVVDVTGATLSGADAGNYTVAINATTTADITPAPLLVAVENETRRAGLPFSGAGSVRYVGLVPGDDASVLFGLPAWGGTAQGASLPGSYSLTVSGFSAANYDIRYADGTLTLLPAENLRTSGEAERQARQVLEAAAHPAAPTALRLTIAQDFVKVD